MPNAERLREVEELVVRAERVSAELPVICADCGETRADCLSPWAFRAATCSWESPEIVHGSGDGGEPCQRAATDLLDGQAFCRFHRLVVEEAGQ